MSRQPYAYPPPLGPPPLSGNNHPSVQQQYPREARTYPLPGHDQPREPGPSGSRYYSPTPSSSQVFAFRPPSGPTYPSRSPYPTQPSYASGSSTRGTNSPARSHQAAYPQPFRPPSTRHQSIGAGDDDDGSSVEDGEMGEKQKLEVKREKNRLKQRNLRIRRANHVSTLEASLETLEQKHKLLEEQHEEVRRREAGLEQYVAGLEDILRRHGLEGELSQARHPSRSSSGGRVRAEGKNEAVKGKKRRKTEDEAADPELAYQLGPQHNASFVQPTPSRPASPVPNRPRTGTSTFQPLVLESGSSHLIIAPSPRSIRIEDLLSPSFTQNDTPTVPTSAFTIQTPDHLASLPAYRPDPPSLGQASVAMSAQGSSESLGSKRSGASGEAISTAGRPPTMWDHRRTSHTQTSYLALPAQPSVYTLSTPPLHPSIHAARVLLRILLADQTHIPISHCILPPLHPSQQTILLNAIYNLTTPQFREQVNEDQIRNMPAVLTKLLDGYSHSSTADLRVVLMPIAILRARVVGFLKEGLPFDVTAFISHVLADARIFGDTGDPDAWEMSDTFWDVWSGWFKAGRKYCSSMSAWRRRHGHTGSNVMEILLGLEGQHSRMLELIGHPEGWRKPVISPPDREMVQEVPVSAQGAGGAIL